jgi:hypothetical protein
VTLVAFLAGALLAFGNERHRRWKNLRSNSTAPPKPRIAGRLATSLESWALRPRLRCRPLIKALEDRDKQVWSYAVTAIAGLGPAAKDAIPRAHR